MNKKSLAVLTGCTALAMTIGVGALANTLHAEPVTAEKISVNIPNAGIALALQNYNISEEENTAELSALVRNTVLASAESEKLPEAKTENKVEKAEEVKAEETKTEEVKEEVDEISAIYAKIAITQVEDYVNVRSIPSTDGEIVGKIFNNCAATIISEEGEWYQIESGNVKGYINSSYFVTGDEAKAAAIACGYVNARVTTETLNVRDSQSTDGRVLTQLPEGGVFDVVEYGDGWVYLNVDEDIQGWVSMEFVDITVDFNTALTLEEEQAKIEEERRLAEEAAAAEARAAEARAAAEAAARAEEAARAEAAAKAQESYVEQPQKTYQTTYDTSTAQAERDAVVAYALQFVGNPYEYGGSSLTNGTDCSGFTMSVYANFGYGLPHQSGSQSACGTEVSINDLRPGDLLFYTNGGSSIGHVALYIGGGQVVHASTPSTGIKVSDAFYRTPVCATRLIN